VNVRVDNMVTRCVCSDRSLLELSRLAEREGIDAEEVMRRTGCGGPGGGCGLCAPYIRVAVALRTGSVPVSSQSALDAMVRLANDSGPDARASGPLVG
jgi:hypothetical protein